MLINKKAKMFIFLLAEVGISLHPSPPLNRLLVFWESRQFLIWMSAALILLGMISLTSDRAQNDRPKTAWLNCHSRYCRVLPNTVGMSWRKKHCFQWCFKWLFINKSFAIDHSDCSFSFSPPAAEEWSSASPALSCAAFGELQSSRGQESSSEPQHWDPESSKCKAEVAGECVDSR